MESTSPKVISEVSRWIISIVVTISLAALLVWAFGTGATIDGHSMMDRLNDGDKVLINRAIYKFSDVERYDIVYFSYGEDQYSVKRIIGLPGEKVTIRNGQVYINDKLIELPEGVGAYNVSGRAEDGITLGSDEYFLLGDNGDSSEDSRSSAVGTINIDNILGKVWFRTSPLGSIGLIESGLQDLAEQD